MLGQLLLALALTVATVAMHVIGIVRIVLPLAGALNDRSRLPIPPRRVGVLIYLVSGLLFLHLLEMGLWAGAFALVGILPDFETALYFSLKSYTTVGYGDVLPPPEWRLLGPLEAAVGVLMLGLSTSVTVAAVQQIFNVQAIRLPMDSD